MATVDFKGLDGFAKKLGKLAREEVIGFNEAAVKELAARVLRKAKLRTPVGAYPEESGKTGGTLRRGWSIGEVSRDGGTYSIEVINPTEYSSYVEFGHRTKNHKGWVEGRFMMTISEEELKRDAPRILERKLKQFIEGALK